MKKAELFALISLLALSAPATAGWQEQASPAEGSIEQTRLGDASKAYPLLAEAIAHYRERGHAGLFEHGLELMVVGAEVSLATRGSR